MLGNINFRFIEWQYGIRPPTTLPVAAGNDNIDFYTIICTAQKKLQKEWRKSLPKISRSCSICSFWLFKITGWGQFFASSVFQVQCFPNVPSLGFPSSLLTINLLQKAHCHCRITKILKELRNHLSYNQTWITKKQSFNPTNYSGSYAITCKTRQSNLN